MAACVDLESTDGGSHRRNRRCARLGSIVITSSGKVGVWSGRRWIWVGGWDHRRQVRLGLLVVATSLWSLTASAGGRVIVPGI